MGSERIYVDYSLRLEHNYTNGKELFYHINQLKLKNNYIGIFDNADESPYMTWSMGMSFNKL